jgi:hypothetical protein
VRVRLAIEMRGWIALVVTLGVGRGYILSPSKLLTGTSGDFEAIQLPKFAG